MSQEIRVYVLDDNTAIAPHLLHLLSRAGYEATLFDHADDLIHCLLVAPSKLVLAEVASPRLGGVLLAKRIRIAAPGTRVLLFALQSSFAYLWEPQQTKQTYFRLLKSPIDPEALLHEVRTFIENR